MTTANEVFLQILAQEEAATIAAVQTRDEAQLQLNMSLVKYAAVRDYLVLRYGPKSLVPGPYRFAKMEAGRAISILLQQADAPLGLLEIVAALDSGGYFLQSIRNERAANAALMNLKNIHKTFDGRYEWKREARDA